jgi:hypothetical protein
VAHRLRHHEHLVADVLDGIRRQPANRPVLSDLGPDVARQLRERRDDERVRSCRFEIGADHCLRIVHRTAVTVTIEHL